MSFEPLHVSDELKQAFRRLALRGNPHWVSYYTQDKTLPPGSNQNQASKGHITNKGVDLRAFAGKPYWYTQAVIDEKKMGLGFWSRSDQGDASTYPFACYDIEPIGDKRVDRDPSPEQRRKTAEEAIRVYGTWKKLARTRTEILWVLLVESSKHHYHVWALFDRPLTKDEHHALMAEARRLHGPIENLDKDTTKAEKRFGSQFRAPWAWKKCRRSEAIASWLRDEALAIRLGEEAKPVNYRWSAKPGALPNADDADPDALLVWAITHHPIPARSNNRGERDHAQGLLVAAMVSRKIPEDLIEITGHAWLDHFQANIQAGIESAKAEFTRVLRQTLNNPNFQPAESPDYNTLIRETVLTPLQSALLGLRVTEQQASPPSHASTPTHTRGGNVVSPLNIQKDQGTTAPQQKADGVCSLTRRVREHTSPLFSAASPLIPLVLEAVTVLSQIELSKQGAKPWLVRFTHKQVLEVISLRNPKERAFHPEEICRVKKLIATYRLAGSRKAESESRLHVAKEVECLRETIKGTPRLASEYEVSPAFRAVLLAGDVVGADGLGRKAPSLPSSGPSAVSTPKKTAPVSEAKDGASSATEDRFTFQAQSTAAARGEVDHVYAVR